VQEPANEREDDTRCKADADAKRIIEVERREQALHGLSWVGIPSPSDVLVNVQDDGEDESRADAEQQHAVGRFQCTHQLPFGLQFQPGGAARRYRINRVQHGVPHRADRTHPQICSGPKGCLDAVEY
jgi:hypothetical protein